MNPETQPTGGTSTASLRASADTARKVHRLLITQAWVLGVVDVGFLAFTVLFLPLPPSRGSWAVFQLEVLFMFALLANSLIQLSRARKKRCRVEGKLHERLSGRTSMSGDEIREQK